MNRLTISTTIVIICIIIIGIYAIGEVNYFSAKTIIEQNTESPIVLIGKIGVEERINNVSLSQGVMAGEMSSIPNEGDVMLFGHRTLQGSPFLRLNELEYGDTIVLEWPGIGEITYKVINKTIVPATYHLHNTQNRDHIFLITCDPIGSTVNRLIIEGEMTNITKLNNQIVLNNPQGSFAYIITAGFLILGLVIAFIYPKDTRIYIIMNVLIISLMLFYFCFNPIPSELIYDHIIFLNGGL